MRWYRIYSCRGREGGDLTVDWSEQIVQACGAFEAWDEVKKLGWWPTVLVNSAWERAEV